MGNRLSGKIYHKMINDCFVSNEMREYLYKTPLSVRDICVFIRLAPLPIEKKIQKLRDLLPYDEASVRSWLSFYEKALESLSLAEDEYFVLRESRYKYENYGICGVDSWQELKYMSFEEVISDIRDRHLREIGGEGKEYYYLLEKKNSSDKNRILYSYCLLEDKIIAINVGSKMAVSTNAYGTDINPQTPYKTGDIVTVDCRPFMPVRHGVILSSYQEGDVNSVRILYRDERGIWRTMSNVDLLIPPVYRMKSYDGVLSGGEELLITVGRYLGSDNEKWEELIFRSNLWDYETCGHELSYVKDEELFEYLKETGLKMMDNEKDLLARYAVLMTYTVEKKVRMGELYEVGLSREDFNPEDTYVDREIEETEKHFINDRSRKCFVVKNRNNEEWDYFSLFEEDGEHYLRSYHGRDYIYAPHVKCIDMIYMNKYPVMLCKVESSFMPLHLQVYIGGSRFFCDQPCQVGSMEGAHLLFDEGELYVEIDDMRYHYRTDFRGDTLYYSSCPKGYEWMRELTWIWNQRLEDKEKIRNWIT